MVLLDSNEPRGEGVSDLPEVGEKEIPIGEKLLDTGETIPGFAEEEFLISI